MTIPPETGPGVGPVAAMTVMELIATLERYLAGDLPDNEVDGLFQGLIDTGLIQYMEDSYQRTARAMVESGRCILRRSEEG